MNLSRQTFDLLVISLGEIQHGPGCSFGGLPETLTRWIFADSNQNASVAVGEVGQRSARLLLGPSTHGSNLTRWTVVFVDSVGKNL